MGESVPTQWTMSTIGDSVRLEYGKSPKEIVCESGEFPIIGTGGIVGQTDEYLHAGPTTVIGRKGTIDKPQYIVGKFWAIDTTYYLDKYKNADPKWLYYWLVNTDIKKYNEASGVPSINRDTLSTIAVVKPPLPEQKKIATILTSVDTVIEKTQAQIDKLNDLKTGMMQELLTKGIGPDGKPHTEFKDSPVGRIPVGWEVRTLDKLCVLQRGFDITHGEITDGKFPVISSSGVQGYHCEYKIKGPGIVVGRKGSIGKIHFTTSNFWPHDTSLYVKNYFNNHLEFVYHKLMSLDLEQYGTKSGSPSLNRNDLHPLRLAIPPPEEQKTITVRIDQCDSIIARKEQTLKSLKNLKKALMQDLLTGKVRVTPDPE